MNRPPRNTERLFCTPEQHVTAVKSFAQALAATTGIVRLAKRTSNLFRSRSKASHKLNASLFANTIAVDPKAGTADVQGMCTYEDFTDACLVYGYMPAVVPELKTITVGGAVSGIGIEATSFRHGLVHETVEEIEVLCGDGKVRICRADNEYADLFRALPNSYGTLGYILRLRCRIIPVKRSVRATYTRFSDRSAFLAAIEQECESGQGSADNDFVEGVCFDPNTFVLVTGVHCDEIPDTTNKGPEPYYKNLLSKSSIILSTRDWIWRWDPDWFWCSRFYGMENPVLRFMFGPWMLRSERYWKIMAWYRKHRIESKVQYLRKLVGLPVSLREPMIQDVEIPLARCGEFLDFYEQHINIRPLWICPLRPLVDSERWTLYSMHPGAVHLNFGFWESVPTNKENAPDHFNRMLEQEVTRLDGRKSLYSTSYFPVDEFWKIYNGDVCHTLKERYDPAARFPDLYQKTVQRR